MTYQQHEDERHKLRSAYLDMRDEILTLGHGVPRSIVEPLKNIFLAAEADITTRFSNHHAATNQTTVTHSSR